MLGIFRRYRFAAIVTAGLALMVAVVLGKSFMDAAGGSGGGGAAAAGGQAKGGGPPSAAVAAAAVARHTFADDIQALGTAQARESIVITPKVADTIRAIRFESGQRVRAGQVLVEMANVEQAADLAEARASHEAAQEELRRYQELYDRGFASQARLDTVRAAADAARARVEAGGSRIADRTIRAPFSGVVGLRTASPGQFVQPGVQIGTLDDLSEIKLDFDVPESQMARLANGIAIAAQTAAFPDEAFTGAISQVDSRVNPTTRTVRVRAVLPNPQERLRPGMLMTVRIRSNPREALATPEIAILEEGAESYVFRVNPSQEGQVVERVRIQTGQRSGGMAEVLAGLNEGDMIVTEGLQAVRPGQPVRLQGAETPSGAAQTEPQLRPRG